MSDERIPTMPQVNEERIPTMPQGVMIGERIPTVPQGEEVSSDGRLATVPQQGGQAGTNRNNLLVTSDIRFTGDIGNSFIIHALNVISADSGESQIYGCERTDDDKKYVARVILSVTPDSEIEKRMTRDKVIKFLDAMSINEDAHILPLVDHGIINVGGKEHYVEIYPFCEDGDLGKRKGNISYQELKEEIIPAVNQALHFFHGAGLVHRDIKPDNLYKYNGRIVVGDFGITCDLREDGFATDKYKTGTLGYYAPELMSQAAIKASDYYSFGQTIWTLYSGEMMYRNILRRYKEYGLDEQRNQVNFAMLSNTYYGFEEIGKDDEFLEVLIRGLLQYDPTHRFDYEKVKKWIAGDKSLVHEISDFETEKTYNRAYKLFGKDCWDDDDVVEMLCAHWKEALEILYEGELKDFYASQFFEYARFFDGIMKKYSVDPEGKNTLFVNSIGLAKVILFLSKNKILCWQGHVFKKLSDISNGIAECILKQGPLLDDYVSLVLSELIGEWYATMPNVRDDISEEINSMTDLFRIDSDGMTIAFFWLRYMFADEKDLQLYGYTELKDFLKYAMKHKEIIYGFEKKVPIVDNSNFMGLLCAWGYSEVVKLFHKAFSKSYAERYELFFDFAEQQMENDADKKLVDNFYFNYGPNAYLVWWKNNLSLYNFVGSGCNELRKNIESILLNPDASIPEQRNVTAKLETLAYRFSEYMDSDLYMAFMGIQSQREEYIYTEMLSGAWYYEFLGKCAPIGFKYYMGL